MKDSKQTLKTYSMLGEAVFAEMIKPEWTEYVMSRFNKNELIQGQPKADGLRRVATEILGVFNSYTQVSQSPSPQNGGRAVVTVSIDWPKLQYHVEACADVYKENSPKFFIHATATAESMAEGRALRKALRLVKILTAEEMNNGDEFTPFNGRTSFPEIDQSQQGTEDSGKITESMLSSLEQIAGRINVDLHLIAAEINPDIGNIRDLTEDEGRQVLRKLDKLQRE
jgi:hypothetical protein